FVSTPDSGPARPLPLQPVNAELAAGLAVSVTVELLAKLPEHVVPQSMPVGELVTMPLPVFETERLTVGVVVTSARNMPRPCVAAIRYLPAHCSSSTETLAGPSLPGDQLAPPSALAKMPTSVPI